MKTQEKTRKIINKDHNSFATLHSSFDEQLSSELKFIVPWVLVVRSKLENHKSVSKNQKI